MNIVINLNKPRDITSQQAVIKVKKIFSARKAGHAGTLDPIATGVLLVCLNEATKITGFLSDLNKEYVTRIKLGERTDTYDSAGRIVEKKNLHYLKEKDIQRVLKGFKGHIKQIPPMYSAIKVRGKPLYKLARKGEDIQRTERLVHIYSIELLNLTPPYLDLKVNCSKGTYIRTFCDDIGNVLGVGAHMFSLERTRIGKFRVEDSTTIEEINTKKEAYHSIDSALSHLNEIILDEDSFYRAKNGVPIMAPIKAFIKNSDTKDGENNPPIPPLTKGGKGGFDKLYINQYVRLKNPENILFAIGKVEGKTLKIQRLLKTIY
ncbi:MAG: tRNA pseudouridine(55) synthase TruB [Nitrospirae bacterium]|jgi:tRNA pseudouridine55 synthase|nr:tRNA pseudouridine(55) synthase TruB [Nitrospirota bacterium]